MMKEGDPVVLKRYKVVQGNSCWTREMGWLKWGVAWVKCYGSEDGDKARGWCGKNSRWERMDRWCKVAL
ncbi:hypothetical protein SESBI_11025 [Sesbania bispinosa]|nr:hypothetical protein SESBI_11025 [Sesbania bispinosa]